MTLNTKRLLSCGLFIYILAGCGGGDSSTPSTNPAPQNPTPPATGSVLNVDASLSIPAGHSDVSGNPVLDISVTSADGIQSIALLFSNNGSQFSLCNNNSSCGGTEFSDVISGVNPGFYGAVPGSITIDLQVTNGLNQTAIAASLPYSWQPPTINNVVASRSVNGTDISVSWDLNPDLLRYNLYLASQSGVNQTNYTSLPDGQALLAVSSSPQQFTGLAPLTDYYLLLAGVDGSGESTFLSEIALPSSGVIPNQNPVALDDTASGNEDTVILIDALNNDTDQDGDALTISTVNPANGTAAIVSNEVEYSPPSDFNGTTTIAYSISDGNGGSDSATITVTVIAQNDPPVATDDNAQTQPNVAVNFDVLNNDSDVDGDTLTVTSTIGAQGSVVIESDNTLTYTPVTNFSGTDTFDYDISDGNGGTATATVSVVVGAAGRVPIANNDSYVALDNQVLNIGASQGVLVNDADPDADVLSVSTTPVTNVTNGTLSLSADGSFTYQGNVGFIGTDSFAYEIRDTNGLTQTAVASIEVRAIPLDLDGDSNSISGDFSYIGQGETSPGNGIGSGLYRIGECLQGNNTRCVMRGNYTETASSGNAPNQTGTYAFVQSYSGIGNSPVLARSVSAGSNTLTFVNIGDVSFELFLFPDNGGVFEALYPETPFADSLIFGAFITTSQTCSGLPVGVPCNIGQVGLVPGADLQAPLDRIEFRQPGSVLVQSDNDSPIAVQDTYSTQLNTQLIINAPGVMSNDSDPDIAVVGDTLRINQQFTPNIGSLAAIGFDEYRQYVFSTAYFGNNVAVNSSTGVPMGSFQTLGEPTGNVDIEVSPESLQLAGNSVPQGMMLFINGQTAAAEIYAFNLDNGVLIAQLNTAVGNGDVVGGAYNPVTQTFFLLQQTQSGTGDPVISEVDPLTGAVLSQITGVFTGLDYDVTNGDLDVNNKTGTLYIVSSTENSILEVTTSGQIVRLIPLPATLQDPSGLAISAKTEQIWVSANNSDIYELVFANQGILPRLQADLVVTTENGTLVTGKDGSFIYTPNSGFTGTDVFTYMITDEKGKTSLSNAVITVN